ncbi:Uncharacterized metal-dependent hydrolase YabD [Coccomyxa sp. Obi]|nr:Uncharacterized metal-dependent hydrolase YabD [Coccomyxa sp. Obi]
MLHKYFDAHCHLQDPRLAHCIDRVIQDATRQGVEYFSCNGCFESDWSKVKDLSTRHKEITPNFGLHPWWVHERSEGWLDILRDMLLSVPHAGLGECGLDHHKRDIADFPTQETVMRAQLRLAKELHRPCSVHCVRAFGSLSSMLHEEGPFPAGLVLHSWAGSNEMVKQLARIEGVYFSLSGHSLRLSDQKLKAMLREIPLDRLLLETDSPDGIEGLQKCSQAPIQSVAPRSSPHGDASLLNHPANIKAVLACVRQHLSCPESDIAEAAFKNALRLFPARDSQR